MDFDLLLSIPRWRILEIIAKNPSSPIEIAEKINTSVAYVSQQLRLLETANLINKTRTKAFEKGKARIVFSLVEEAFYVSALLRDTPEKMKIEANEHQKMIMRIWSLPDKSLQYLIEKFYWAIESEIADIDGIGIVLAQRRPHLYCFTQEKKTRAKIEYLLKESKGLLDFSCMTDFSEFKGENIKPLYDPEHRLLKLMKGGKQ